MGLNVLLTADQFGALPEAVREHYKKDGDGYALSVEGELPSVKAMRERLDKREAEVKEFRENNISLKKQNAVLEHEAGEARKVVDKANTLEQKQTQMKQAGINSAADVRKLHERLTVLEKERDAAVHAQRTATARAVLTEVADKAGIRPEARDALALLAERDGLTTTPEGKVVFATSDGTPKQTADGDLTPGDWVQELAKNGGSYMFAPSAGTGGQTGPPGSTSGMVANRDAQLAEQAIADGSLKVGVER